MSVGSRLSEERKRLGISQERLAAIAGVAKNTAINWEKGASSPTASALNALSESGVDAIYVLTGRRVPESGPPEIEMIENDLAEIEYNLIEPSRDRYHDESDEEADKRLIGKAVSFLKNTLEYDAPAGLPPELIERATSLLDIVESPLKLSLYRAADFAHKRRRRDEEREMLKIWLEGWPYQPNDTVMKLLSMVSLEYRVPHKVLVEIAQEIFTDVSSGYYSSLKPA